MENTDEFVNLRTVNDARAFEVLILKKDSNNESIEYNDEDSNTYQTIAEWATIGNLLHIADGIKKTSNGILYSEGRNAFVEFNHETVTINFAAVEGFGTILSNYLYNNLDQLDLFIINEDKYLSVIDEAESLGYISGRIRINKKYIA